MVNKLSRKNLVILLIILILFGVFMWFYCFTKPSSVLSHPPKPALNEIEAVYFFGRFPRVITQKRDLEVICNWLNDSGNWIPRESSVIPTTRIEATWPIVICYKNQRRPDTVFISGASNGQIQILPLEKRPEYTDISTVIKIDASEYTTGKLPTIFLLETQNRDLDAVGGRHGAQGEKQEETDKIDQGGDAK